MRAIIRNKKKCLHRHICYGREHQINVTKAIIDNMKITEAFKKGV